VNARVSGSGYAYENVYETSCWEGHLGAKIEAVSSEHGLRNYLCKAGEG
jgi:hypothetical protein